VAEKTSEEEPITEKVNPVLDETVVDAAADDTHETDSTPDEEGSDEAAVEQDETPKEEPSDTKTNSKGGILPMLGAGVVVALLGFVAGRADVIPNDALPEFLQRDSTLAETVADQKLALENLEQRLTEFAKADDIVALQSQLTETVENGAAVRAALADQIANLPVLTGSAANVGIAAVQDLIDAQNLKIAALTEQLQAQTEQTQSSVAQLEAAAVEEALFAQARAALSRVQAAIEIGAPFGSALADFSQASTASVPEVLQVVASTGVPALASLQDEFPPLARQALAAARSETPVPETTVGKLSAFLARQTGARSVTPREGSDADAVLSRVEAAVRKGALNDALAELDTLPDTSKSVLSPWAEAVKRRLDASTAAAQLRASLKSN
jgi:hypothetical protein